MHTSGADFQAWLENLHSKSWIFLFYFTLFFNISQARWNGNGKFLLKNFDLEDRLNKNRHLLKTARIASIDELLDEE